MLRETTRKWVCRGIEDVVCHVNQHKSPCAVALRLHMINSPPNLCTLFRKLSSAAAPLLFQTKLFPLHFLRPSIPSLTDMKDIYFHSYRCSCCHHSVLMRLTFISHWQHRRRILSIIRQGGWTISPLIGRPRSVVIGSISQLSILIGSRFLAKGFRKCSHLFASYSSIVCAVIPSYVVRPVS